MLSRCMTIPGNRTRAMLCVLYIGLAVFGGGSLGAAEPTFDVVSIRPANVHYPSELGPLTFRMQSSVTGFIALAYGLEDDEISGGPAWASSNQYDVQAKAGSPASLVEIRAMVATMLRERFRLRMHFESKETSVYLLTTSGKKSKLTEAKEGTPRDARGAFQLDRNTMFVRGASMSFFARKFLTSHLGRPVLDRTGLNGSYTFNFRYDDSDEFGSVFSSLGDLGLKVVPSKASLSIAVIDSVASPTSN